MPHAPTQSSLPPLAPRFDPVAQSSCGGAGWPPGIRRAVAYLERHLYEPVTVAEVAAAACMSRFHLARVFRAATGASPMGYLRQRRIEQAQALLRDGDRKVCQIASDLCFFDQSHFVRRFRQATGETPRRFAAAHAATRD